MSRPPRPYPSRPTTPARHPLSGPLRYLPLEHADLIALQRALHGDTFGKPPALGEAEPTATLFDLAASVAHVLARYQDFYAGEAFLGSAATATSLVRHARRLAYVPDPGLSAVGWVALTVHPGQAGVVEAGLGLTSAPAGTRPALAFETLSDRGVDAAWNELQVAGAEIGTPLRSQSTIALQGVGLPITAGQLALVRGPGEVAAAIEVTAVVPDPVTRTTRLTLNAPLPASLPERTSPWDPASPEAGWRVMLQPAVTLRLFGHTLDPVTFSPGWLRNDGAWEAPPDPVTSTTLAHGWQADGLAIDAQHVFLAGSGAATLADTWLVGRQGATVDAHLVTEATERLVTFQVGRGVKHQEVTVTAGVASVTDVWTLSLTWHAGPSTVVRLRTSPAGADQPRSAFELGRVWYGGFRRAAPLVDRAPSDAPVDNLSGLRVVGEHPGLERGMRVAFVTRDGSVAQIVELTEVEVELGLGTTRVAWTPITPLPPGFGWTLGDLVVLGNVVAAAHGETRTGPAGSSDGITPFQRFVLKKAPLAHDAGPDGAAPAIEVAVGGVTWRRVVDFAASGPHDRVYVVEVDASGVPSVVFGDGLHGAVPPAGQRNVVVTWRVGLGDDANVEVGAASRLARAQPIVARAANPVPFAGGTDPADPEAIRTSATRYIRTFDRAVSVGDHADLALQFPGVARSAASWDDLRGIVLVAATAVGAPVPDTGSLRAFLDARRDTTVRLVLASPEPVPVYLSVYVEVEPGFVRADVEDAVRIALAGAEDAASPGLFTFAGRTLGQPAHLSEVYAALDGLPGLSYVEVVGFDLAPGRRARDVVIAGITQWLRATANEITFVPGSGA